MEIKTCSKYSSSLDSTSTTSKGSSYELPGLIKGLLSLSGTVLWILSLLLALIEPTLRLIWLTQEALLEAAEWCNESSRFCRSKITTSCRRDRTVGKKIFWDPKVATAVLNETVRYLTDETYSLNANRWNSCSESNVHLFEGRDCRTGNSSRCKSRMVDRTVHAYGVPGLSTKDCPDLESVNRRPKSADFLNRARLRSGGIHADRVCGRGAFSARENDFADSASVNEPIVTLTSEQVASALQSLQHLIDLGLMQNEMQNAECPHVVMRELLHGRDMLSR